MPQRFYLCHTRVSSSQKDLHSWVSGEGLEIDCLKKKKIPQRQSHSIHFYRCTYTVWVLSSIFNVRDLDSCSECLLLCVFLAVSQQEPQVIFQIKLLQLLVKLVVLLKDQCVKFGLISDFYTGKSVRSCNKSLSSQHNKSYLVFLPIKRFLLIYM